MRSNRKRIVGGKPGAFAAISTIALAFGASNALGVGMTSSDYLDALKIANAKVQQQKNLASSANALSSAIVRKLYGRYYKVGDQWDVLGWYQQSTEARMTSEPEQLNAVNGKLGIFHYEVTEVKTGAEPQVRLKITQREDFGVREVDARVQSLQLTLAENLAQKKKSYQLAGRPEPLEVSPNGIHTSLSLLELFPLDAPDVLTVDGTQAREVPALPDPLKKLASQAGYAPDARQSLWFEQDDFFGRPLQILWQHGDPWPAYVRTANGAAILIKKGGA